MHGMIRLQTQQTSLKDALSDVPPTTTIGDEWVPISPVSDHHGDTCDPTVWDPQHQEPAGRRDLKKEEVGSGGEREHRISEKEIRELTVLLSLLHQDVTTLIQRTESLEAEIKEHIQPMTEELWGVVMDQSEYGGSQYSSDKGSSRRSSRSNFTYRRRGGPGSNTSSSSSLRPSGPNKRWSQSRLSIEAINESNPVSPLAANIPCNEKGTDYKTLANQALGAVMAEVAEFDSDSVDGSIMMGSWKSLVKREGIDAYYKLDRHTKQRVVLAQTKIYCPRTTLVDFIADPSTRLKYDTIAQENYVLQEFDDDTTFNYVSFRSKACMMEYNVDLCYLATQRTIGSKHIIAYSSILDNPYAPSVANVKRGWLYHTGFQIEETEDSGTREKCLLVSYVVHVDMRLPDMPPPVRNALLERQALSLAAIRDEVEGRAARESRFCDKEDDSQPFAVRRLPSNQSLDMQLSLGDRTTAYSYHHPTRHATGSPSDSSHLELASPGEAHGLGLRRRGSSNHDYGSHPDLCFWSLDDEGVEVGSDVDDGTSDYVTMANSAAASLYREYINVLEAVRFSTVCPEKLGWKILEKNDEVWTLEKKGSTIQCMAGVANIRASEREITDFLRDPRTRFTYDATLFKTHIVSEINNDLRLVYSHHKARSCFIGHGRDMLYFQYDRKEGEKRILAHASCEHPRCPVNPDIIRSTMYETGFIIEPLPEAEVSSVVYVVKVDLGGMEAIPESLVRYIKRRQPKILLKIKEYFER